jgi:hypothetical protein
MPTPYALSSDLVSAWPAKSLAVAQYVDGYKLDTGPVQNAQTGTTFTFALSDTTKTVTANNSAASAYTIPPQSAVVWEAYTVLRLVNLGAGVVTLTAGAGVTLTGTVTVPQYGSVSLMRTASDAWTITGNGAAGGMDLITPTSVAGSGVTLSGGQVNMSAVATAVNINGCFTSAYDNYMMVWDIRSASAASWYLNMRLRAAGTDAATSYLSAFAYPSFAADNVNGFGLSAGTTSFVFGFLGDTAIGSSGIMSVRTPAIAARTTMNYQSGTFAAGGSSWAGGGIHTPATAYDGFSIAAITGNITGNLRIYGLRNS